MSSVQVLGFKIDSQSISSTGGDMTSATIKVSATATDATIILVTGESMGEE